MKKYILITFVIMLTSCVSAEKLNSVVFINGTGLRLFPQAFFIFVNEQGVAAVDKEFEEIANSIERERVSNEAMAALVNIIAKGSGSAKDVQLRIYADNNEPRVVNITYQQLIEIANKAQFKSSAAKQWIAGIEASEKRNSNKIE